MTLELSRAIASDAKALGVKLASGVSERLATLLRRVHAFSKRINLIAPATLLEDVDRHISDSLALLRLVDRPELTGRVDAWWDVGSGGGFPGLVWAVARPDLRLRLVEPTAKKVALLRQLVRELQLTHVEVTQTHVETLPPPVYPVGFVSRAVFSPDVWLRKAEAIGSPGGVVLITAGRREVPEVISRAALVDRFTLPSSGAQRVNAAVFL